MNCARFWTAPVPWRCAPCGSEREKRQGTGAVQKLALEGGGLWRRERWKGDRPNADAGLKVREVLECASPLALCPLWVGKGKAPGDWHSPKAGAPFRVPSPTAADRATVPAPRGRTAAGTHPWPGQQSSTPLRWKLRSFALGPNWPGWLLPEPRPSSPDRILS